MTVWTKCKDADSYNRPASTTNPHHFTPWNEYYERLLQEEDRKLLAERKRVEAQQQGATLAEPSFWARLFGAR